MSESTVLPTVNMNGTSRDELVEQRCKVYVALDVALKALGEMAPHGRDYQGETEKYKAAREQHRQRTEQLRLLRSQIAIEAVAIQKLP